eukprot:1869967-Amphidinium_carterae.2
MGEVVLCQRWHFQHKPTTGQADHEASSALFYSLQEQCGQSFAAEIMLTLQSGGEFKLDAGLTGFGCRVGWKLP